MLATLIRQKDSQEKLLVPDGVEIPENSFGPAFGLSHLYCDVGVAGARLVFGLQTLST